MYKKGFKRRPRAIQLASGSQVTFRRALGGPLELPGYLAFSCQAPLGRFWVPFWCPLDFEGGAQLDVFNYPARHLYKENDVAKTVSNLETKI